jgi:hypothetical protein
MRACARVALVLVAVSASIGLAACSAIDDLKAAVSRWFDVGKSLGGRGGVFTDDSPDTTPMIPPEKQLERRQARHQRRRTRANGRRPLRRNYRPPTPPRRQSRKAPSRNPCHLSLRRRNCIPSGPKHRHPELFHADIGHRMVCRLTQATWPPAARALGGRPPAVISPLLRHALGRRVGRQGDPGVA